MIEDKEREGSLSAQLLQQHMHVEVDTPREFSEGIPNSDLLERRLTIRIPGSSANIGPGFDTFALALSRYTWIDFAIYKEKRQGAAVVPFGEIAHLLPADESNLIVQILKKHLTAADMLDRMQLSVHSDLQLGRGLGSSGSAIMGAVYAAAFFSGGSLESTDLLRTASEFESHIDNLSASLLGDFVVSHMNDERIITKRLKWPENWGLFILVPSYSVSTAKARSVLPAAYPRADVIENLQHAALMTSAIEHADSALFRTCLRDKLHEPYRAQLIPELERLRVAIQDEPVLGAVLSGAGSSMLVIVERHSMPAVEAALHAWVQTEQSAISVIESGVDRMGLSIISEF